MNPRHEPHRHQSLKFHVLWNLEHFSARATDVFIATSLKSGTTWLQQILHQLRTGGDPDFECINDVVPFLGGPPPAGKTPADILANIETLPDPRIFKTHLLREHLPVRDGVKIVVCIRDPRDCLVSMYHFFMDMHDDTLPAPPTASRAPQKPGGKEIQSSLPPRVKVPRSFQEAYDYFMNEKIWYRHMVSWWPHRDDPNVLMLRFKDMKRDLGGCIHRIAEFVGWSVTDEQFARVLEYSSFAWMKANSHRFNRLTGDDPLAFKTHGLIRKGEVGGYRTSLLSDVQAQEVLSVARALLAPECMAFLDLA